MAESGVGSTAVPINVPEPEEHAPPTLAEPASGPVAEMSGALQHEGKDEAVPAVGNDSSTAKPVTKPANGTVEPASQPATETQTQSSEQPSSEAPAATEDTEMKDAPETTAATTDADPSPETNGTPAEKKGANGKRKSVGGVPEHKNKKLNKKKSMPKITHLDAKPGDYYFARLKSYPPWPSIICDEDMLPTSLLTTRPVTTKKADGTYNEPYADGGKKVVDRTFPIMFLFTNEFAWIPNTDLGPLDPAECKDVATKSKTKALISAYEVAAEGHDLQHFKDMLMDHARAMQEDEDAKEAREAEKAAKADKKKRKSEVKAAEEDVEMADADAEPATKKASKKRKKGAESDDEQPEKPAKTPKTTKLKLTTNKTPTTDKKAKDPKPAKPKSEKKKTKAASDEEKASIEEKEEEPLDPVEARKAREKEVLFLRHKLQKGFLTRDQAPREDEMPVMSNYIKKLEVYADLEVAIIRATKINKVLKALVKLNTIPRDEEFQFRKRSVELLGKWNKILGTEAEPADKDKASPPTNGVHDESEKAAEKGDETVDGKQDDVEEPKDKVAEPAEAAEKISAEVPAEAGAKASVIESLEKDAAPVKEGESKNTGETKNGVGPAVIERVPESAAAAHEAQEVVKATE